jgi:PAS domain S-box-containing protein
VIRVPPVARIPGFIPGEFAAGTRVLPRFRSPDQLRILRDRPSAPGVGVRLRRSHTNTNDAARRNPEQRRGSALPRDLRTDGRGHRADRHDGRFTLVNDRFCRIVDRPRDELLGMTMCDITHPSDVAAHAGLVERLAADGTAFEIDKRCVRPDGSEVWVRCSVSGLRAPDGRVIGFVAVMLDDSDRRHAEDEKARLASLVEHSDDFIAMADLDGYVTYMNPGGRRMIGLPPEGDLGALHFTDYVAPESRDLFVGTVIPTVLRDGIWTGEMQLVNRLDRRRRRCLAHDLPDA